MSKIIGFFIVVGAFFVALFYVLVKKNFRLNFTKNTPFLKRKFLITVAILMAFLSHGKISHSVNELVDPQISTTNIKEDQKLKFIEDIQKTGEWIQLKKIWSSLEKIEWRHFNHFWEEVEKQKEENNKYLASLVNKGYISQNVAYIISYVYGELLSHRLHSTSLMTCYLMSLLTASKVGVKRNLEKRLKLLSDISKQGSINENVLQEAKNNIAREIEFLNRAQEFFEKRKNVKDRKTYWEEEEALAKLFKDGKVDESIKAEEDVAKAAELIVQLNINNADSLDQLKSKLDQLKNFKEWSQIKSNWQSVSKIDWTPMDAIKKVISEKKKENWELLRKLVRAGLLSREGAKVFNDIYGDRIYHHLRPMAASCYELTILETKQAYTRDDLEKQLKALSDIYKKETVNKEVLRQAEINLLKNMEIILLINELWNKEWEGNWDKYREEEQKILSYFVSKDSKVYIKDDIKIRRGVKEAMEIIRLLYSD